MPDEPLPHPGFWNAKRVLYAEHDLVVSESFAARALAVSRADKLPTIADIPPAHTPIKAGRPVMTVFASAASRGALVRA